MKQLETVSPSSSGASEALGEVLLLSDVTVVEAMRGMLLVDLSLNSKMYRSLLPRSPWSVEEQRTLASMVIDPEVVSTCAYEAGSVTDGDSGSSNTKIGDDGPYYLD